MGLSRRTTAPSVHPCDLGCSGFWLSGEFACLSGEGWLCGPCGVCFSGQVSRAGERPDLKELTHPAAPHQMSGQDLLPSKVRVQEQALGEP